MIHRAENTQVRPTTLVEYNDTWPLSDNGGDGFYVEGEVVEVHNQHIKLNNNNNNNNNNNGDNIARYIAFVVSVTAVKERVKDDKGHDLAPSTSTNTAQPVGNVKGHYLNTTKYVAAKEKVIPSDEFYRKIPQYSNQKLFPNHANLHPTARNHFEFWGTIEYLQPIDLKSKNKIRLATAHNSHFVESVTKETEGGQQLAHTNYHGNSIISNFGDQVSDGRTRAVATDKQKEQLKGIERDDDEWA